MTNEDIERKCLEYSQAATPSYTNGTFDRYAIAQAFEDGAEWHINSVWHNATEIPEIAQILLVEYEDGHHSTPILYTGKANRDGWKKWAYVKDLLPTKEGEK